MHIIAIGWIYVVSMMAITEKSVVAGIMTFTWYCAIPLGAIWGILFLRKRRLAQQKNPAEQRRENNLQTIPADDSGNSIDNSTTKN
jgi:hypothetical protein